MFPMVEESLEMEMNKTQEQFSISIFIKNCSATKLMRKIFTQIYYETRPQ